MKTTALALGLAAALTAGGVVAETMPLATATQDGATQETAAAPAAAETDENALTLWGVRVGNPFDSATWWDGHRDGGHGERARINPADPNFWMAFIDPERHSVMHMTLTDPATLGQFLELETYTAMMDFGTWMSWMDVDNYAPMFRAQTWTYWMQPGAYMHMFDTASYAQMIDPAAYEKVWDSAKETMGIEVN